MFAAASGLATIIGSVLGGAIAGALGIPGLFLLCAVGSLIGTVIVAVALLGPRTRRASRGRPDELEPWLPIIGAAMVDRHVRRSRVTRICLVLGAAVAHRRVRVNAGRPPGPRR